MKAKFSLIAYVKGKRITIDTTEKNLQSPEGATKFYLRYTDENGKRRDQTLGSHFAHARAEVSRREAARDYERRTGEKFPSVEKKTNEQPLEQIHGLLSSQIATWLDKKRITPGMARTTCDRYERGLTLFQVFVKQMKEKGIRQIKSAKDVGPEDAFRFSNYLRNERKLAPRTTFNYFRYLMMFQKGIGCDLKIPVKQWGEPPKRKPQAYTQEQLDALFLCATSEESLLFKSLLFSGMRNKELANLTYADIDFKDTIWSVQPKNGWEVKSKAAVRGIPIPRFHTKDIHERMILLKRSEQDLVFPNERGKVHNYFLEILKDLSVKAGVTGRVDIHKFRSTCATTWLREGVDVFEVARRLGHSDLKTIQQYIEMVNLQSKATQDQTTKTFARFDRIREVGA